MSLNTRRLYLSSLDSNIDYINDGHINIDLTRASIHALNSELIAVSLVRIELPSTVAIGSYTDSIDPKNNNLIMRIEVKIGTGTPVVKDFIFNSRFQSANPLQFPLTQQNVINDVIAYINEAFGAEVVKIDDSVQTLGLFRLIATAGNQVIFIFDHTSPEILRALGLSTIQNTQITENDRSPFNWDMSQILPVVRIKTNLNFNSFSSDISGDNNILDSVSTATTNGNQYYQTLAISVGDNNINIKNKSMIIHENFYMSKQVIPAKRINNLEIKLVSQDDKLITVGQQPFTLVLQVDILEGV
tara:strand:- start:3849 stop:4751 length:903 start_codon:yes stop_codon:yes gene_type:complete